MAENDQNIQLASLDQFKRIVTKDQGSNKGKGERIAKHLLKNSEKCRRKRLHSAIYCQVCFPHCNINGFQ